MSEIQVQVHDSGAGPRAAARRRLGRGAPWNVTSVRILLFVSSSPRSICESSQITNSRPTVDQLVIAIVHDPSPRELPPRRLHETRTR